MTDRFIDDTHSQGGSATTPYTAKNTAADFWSEITGVVATGDIVYVHKNHSEDKSTGDLSLAVLTQNPGIDVVRIDFADDSYDTTTTTNNFITSGGNYQINIGRGNTWHGVRFSSNEHILLQGSDDQNGALIDCTLNIGVNDRMQLGYGVRNIDNCTITTSDTSNSSTQIVYMTAGYVNHQFRDCTFSGTGVAYRDVLCTLNNGNVLYFIGCDFSAMTRDPTKLVNTSSTHSEVYFVDCDLPPNYVVYNSTPTKVSRTHLVRCGGADEYEVHSDSGSHVIEDTITRTGGHDSSWEITTSARCGKANVFYTAWIETAVTSATSTNFDLHIAYSGSQLTEEEIFAELEFIDSATAPFGSVVSSQKKASKGDTVSNHASSSETWGGTETYEEYIRITATPGIADTMVRMRVGVEKTSQTTAVYLDPYIETS